MSTSYGLNAGMELEVHKSALRALPVRERPEAGIGLVASPIEIDRPVPSAAGTPAAAVSAFPSEDWSTLNEASVATQFRRAVRTRAPFLLADLLALVLSSVAAQGMMWLVYPPAAQALGPLAPVALFPLVVVFWLSELYSEIWVHPVIEFRQLSRVSTVCLLAAALGGAMAWPFPLWCVAAWMSTVVLVPLMRTVARRLCLNRAWWGYPTLVIGSGEGAAEVAGMLLEAPRSGLRPVILTDPEHTCRTSIIPVINDEETLESILRVRGIRHAVVSLPAFSIGRLTEVLDRYSGLVPHLLVLSDASTLPTLWGASRSFGRLSGIEVRNGLLLATLGVIKRGIDLAVVASALALFLPLLLVIAIGIKLTSDGPIFYGHTRIGRHGKKFKAWKFRTMHTNGDAILREYLERVMSARIEWDNDRKLRNDPRVTPIGKLLRKLSLDELPQMWNVLKGDMSIVGPRPIVESEVKLYGEVFRHYTTVKPGITGLWQVSGRTNLSYEDRVLLDQFYVRHWSPWLDVYILAKTVVALLKRDGAY